jgi:chitinase
MRPLLLLSPLVLVAAAAASGPYVVGYYPEWGTYDRNYQVYDIPAQKINIINYAFAKINDEGEIDHFDAYAATDKFFPGDSWDENLRGNLKQLIKLKNRFPHLRTMVSVGGWTLSGPFSNMAMTEAGRNKFADSCVAYIRAYQFDGVDIDWEYPVGGGLFGGHPADKQNFTLLLQALRAKLNAASIQDGKTYLLTIAAPAGPDKIANIEPLNISQHLDFINVMTYDFHGTWENTTDHHAPLYGADGNPFTPQTDFLSTMAAMKAYTDAGVPAHKLLVGYPIYGRGWRGVPATNNGLRQPSQGAATGTWEPGMFDYKDLVNRMALNPGQYSTFWDDTQKASYIYSASQQNGLFVTYDSPQAAQTKLDWAKSKGFNGAMFWELSGDTSSGETSLISLMAHSELPRFGATLVFQNSGTGAVAHWRTDGTQVKATGIIGNPGTQWKLVAIGDADGDAIDDLTFRNTQTGAVVQWLIRGDAVPTSRFVGSAPLDWSLEAAMDVNGNRAADLVWRRASDGLLVVWEMSRQGAVTATHVLGSVDPAVWSLDSASPIDQTLGAQLLWRQTSSGTLASWSLNQSFGVDGASVLAVIPSGWRATGASNLDRSGPWNLLFQSDSGAISWWNMPAAGEPSFGGSLGEASGWRLVGSGRI